MLFFFFFFQAEDGIRDIGVTGVQTCALPISGCAHGGVGPTTALHVSTHGERDDSRDRTAFGRRRGGLVGLVRAGIRRCRSAVQWRDAVHVRGGRGGRDDDEGGGERSTGDEANDEHDSS